MSPADPIWTRRRFLVATGATAAATWLASCGSGNGGGNASVISPSDPAIAAREAQRQIAGAGLVTVDLTPGPVSLDLAGRVIETIGYNGSVPGPPIRVRAGDVLEVHFRNLLADPTVTHWHGLAIRNDMDGVPNITQPPIAPGEAFTYRFVVPDPGTYWYHPHMGLDLDRGMYAPIIVEDPDEPVAYDADEVIVLDDWLDGIDGATPASTLAGLKALGGMGSMGGMHHDGMGGTGSGQMTMNDFGDVTYPLHLINGRPPNDPPTISLAPGSRVRLRFINAGSDTVYRVAVGGRAMTVSHLDGFPIEPVEVDTVLLAMGERADVIVEIPSGVWPIQAVPEGKDGSALAWLRTTDATGSTPGTRSRLAEHDGQTLDLAAIRPAAAVAFPPATPDRVVDLALTASMTDYQWGINGRSFAESEPIRVSTDERLRMRFRNNTMMIHPMHLHGHTFALASTGVRKDTVLVRPMQTVEIDVIADNPGQWMLHCHNTYHLETGMATTLAYDK